MFIYERAEMTVCVCECMKERERERERERGRERKRERERERRRVRIGLLWLILHLNPRDTYFQNLPSLMGAWYKAGFQPEDHIRTSQLTCLRTGCTSNDWPSDFRIVYFLDVHTFFRLAQFTWLIPAVPCLLYDAVVTSCFEIHN